MPEINEVWVSDFNSWLRLYLHTFFIVLYELFFIRHIRRNGYEAMVDYNKHSRLNTRYAFTHFSWFAFHDYKSLSHIPLQ